ncbi:uncharacterized protein LOC135197065 [Macrobrachium nipponense]|uniref:uncharacterized protein LOC135197065 n=1 Tax=Macrobrachium nipponense TaxID=159736 RepID=UPI0030C865A7
MAGQGGHPAPLTVEEVDPYLPGAGPVQPSKNKVSYSHVLREVFGEFFQSTAISGVSNAGRSTYSVLCIIWIAISIAATYRTVIDVIAVITDYQSYPYNTKIQVQHRSEAPFPAVTLCNQNRIDCSKLIDKMLAYSQNDTETSQQLIQLYNVSQCGVSIGCGDVFKKYVKYVRDNNSTLPPILFDVDMCLRCNNILVFYQNLCENDDDNGGKKKDLPQKLSELDFLWQSMESEQKSKCNEEGKKSAPTDLSTCPSNPNQILQAGISTVTNLLTTNIANLQNSLTGSVPSVGDLSSPSLLGNSTVSGLLANNISGLDLTTQSLAGITVPTVGILATSDSSLSLLGDLTTKAQNASTLSPLNVLTTGVQASNILDLTSSSQETTTSTSTKNAISDLNVLTTGVQASNILDLTSSSQETTTQQATKNAISDLNVLTTGVQASNILDLTSSSQETTTSTSTKNAISDLNVLTTGVQPNSILDLTSSSQETTTSTSTTTTGQQVDLTTSSKEATTSSSTSALPKLPIADTAPKLIRKKRGLLPLSKDSPLGFDGPPDLDGPRGQQPQMEVSEEHDTKMRFLALYMNLSDATREDLSYDFGELIKDCVFLGDNCLKETLFTKRFFNTYGNCYTFNGEGTFNTSYTGSTYSLSLVLDVIESSYLPMLLTEKAGARIAIHQTFTYPLLDDDGLDAPPGMASSFAMRERELSMLADPYEANCTKSWANTSYALRGNGSSYILYTTSECLRMCMQRILVTNCSCVHPLYPQNFTFNGTLYGDHTMKYCNLTSGNESDINCVTNKFKEYSNNPKKANCGCEVACSNFEYPRVLSMTLWPPLPSKDYASKKYDTGPRESSLMKIEVFYNSLSREVIYQSEVYSSPWDLVSSLGGALSLYMGISVFLMMEVLELIVILVYKTVLYTTGRYRPMVEHTAALENHNRPTTGLVYPIVTPETLGFLQKAGHVVKVSHGDPYANPCISTRKQHAMATQDHLNSAFDKAFSH